MYEGKEGLKIIMDYGRIEILPGSVHLWCNIDENVKRFYGLVNGRNLF